MAHFVTLETKTDKRGSLTFFETSPEFSLQRIFYIYDVNEKEIRGGHKHKRNHQILICPKGQCMVNVWEKEKKFMQHFLLNDPQVGVYLHPDDWHEMLSFSEGAFLLVLASEKYSLDDYIYENQ